MTTGDKKRLLSIATYQIKLLFVSIRFLTIIPCFRVGRDETRYFGGALYYFCVTGAFVGGIAVFICYICMQLFPLSILAAILVIYLSLISGFIHIDGLADTADGFLSGKPQHDCLVIMRDSRIGVMGAVAICSVFLLKFSAITSMSLSQLPTILLLVPAAGRTSIVLSMAALPYARRNGGLGELFYSSATRRAALSSLFLLACLTFLVNKSFIFPIVFTIMFSVGIFSLICRRRIGGITGDTLGAICEITETVVLVVLTIQF